MREANLKTGKGGGAVSAVIDQRKNWFVSKNEEMDVGQMVYMFNDKILSFFVIKYEATSHSKLFHTNLFKN